MANEGQFSRRDFLRKAATNTAAVGAVTCGVGLVAQAVYEGTGRLTDPRKAPDQLLIPRREELALTENEIEFRIKLFHAVNNNKPQEAEALLRTMPEGLRSIEIAAYPFQKAINEGTIEVMNTFLARFPKLANAMFKDSIGGATPLEFAFRENRHEAFKTLHSKGAKFDLTYNPSRFVSSSVYNGDLEFLRYLDTSGFQFPTMQGYGTGISSPFKDLVFSAEFRDIPREKYLEIAGFLASKGYDPLEKQGTVGNRKNAIDYANEEYGIMQKYINEGGDPTQTFSRFWGTARSSISVEQAQQNMKALIECFKTLQPKRGASESPGHAARLALRNSKSVTERV